MARIFEPTPEQETALNEWVASRPKRVRRIAERFKPWILYRMKSTGQRVTIESFGRDAKGNITLTVNITGDFNLVTFDRQVFGIDPDDLEECDLPAKGEPVGTALTEKEEVDAFIELTRPHVLKARKCNEN